MRIILSILLLISSTFAQTRRQPKPQYQKAMMATFEIVQRLPKTSSVCVGTAIAPQALLTATHCELKTDNVVVSGKEAIIVDRIRDNNDHTIYLLDFEDGSVFGALADFKPNDVVKSDEVFIIGSPGAFTRLFRKGVLSGFDTDLLEGVLCLYDIQGYFGDSGAGIFRDEDGVLVGVISSTVYNNSNNEERVQFMAAMPLHFMPEDLEKAFLYHHVNDTNKPGSKPTP